MNGTVDMDKSREYSKRRNSKFKARLWNSISYRLVVWKVFKIKTFWLSWAIVQLAVSVSYSTQDASCDRNRHETDGFLRLGHSSCLLDQIFLSESFMKKYFSGNKWILLIGNYIYLKFTLSIKIHASVFNTKTWDFVIKS